MAFSRYFFARVCLWGASNLALAVFQGHGQEATSEPVFVYGREWVASVPQSDLNGDELTENEQLAAAIQRVPNATINAAGANSYLDVYSIRGLGNTPNFSKQAVTLYVDGVPSSSTYTNFTELGELEQVTVFRGPQGDFFGKNSEAGIVEMRTIFPRATPRWSVTTTGGSYDFASVQGFAAGPIKPDTAFAKFEAGYLRRDGFLENTFLRTRPDFQEHLFARAALRVHRQKTGRSISRLKLMSRGTAFSDSCRFSRPILFGWRSISTDAPTFEAMSRPLLFRAH
jgi:outer membrane receptor protein involved in Fe transport